MNTIAPQPPTFGSSLRLREAAIRRLDRLEAHRLLPAHRNPPPLVWDADRALWVPSAHARETLDKAATQLDWGLQSFDEEGPQQSPGYERRARNYGAATLLLRPGVGFRPRLNLGVERNPETGGLSLPLAEDPMQGFRSDGPLPAVSPQALATTRRWVGRAFRHQTAHPGAQALSPVAREELRRGSREWEQAARWHERQEKVKHPLAES